MNNIVSALEARTQLGQILRRASSQGERFPVDRRGEPSVIIMGIRDYIKNIAPTPDAYRELRAEAQRSGASSLSLAEIDHEIAAVRREKRARASKPIGV